METTQKESGYGSNMRTNNADSLNRKPEQRTKQIAAARELVQMALVAIIVADGLIAHVEEVDKAIKDWRKRLRRRSKRRTQAKLVVALS